MGDKNLESALKEILDTLSLSAESEIVEQYGDIIEKIVNCGYDIQNPDTFNILINYRIEQILDQVVNALNPDAKEENLWKLQFLYLNYRFMDRHIRELIEMREGMFCCADKTRWVLGRYLKYIVEDSIKDNRKGRYCDPNFGSLEEWINFCEGIHSLYYGTCTEYLIAYKKLLSSSTINFKREEKE